MALTEQGPGHLQSDDKDKTDTSSLDIEMLPTGNGTSQTKLNSEFGY
jgi:hypothetical protein